MAKILVIDDERMVRETLKIILSAVEHEVLLAENGATGMKLFKEANPDLVITDILMPEKEGMETIRDLRELRPDIPIIAISGGGRVGNMSFLRVAERFGANRTISKPFEPELVIQAIEELLRKAA
jgi:two-component system, chemotaxis family, chemotaxis protein CheY